MTLLIHYPRREYNTEVITIKLYLYKYSMIVLYSKHHLIANYVLPKTYSADIGACRKSITTSRTNKHRTLKSLTQKRQKQGSRRNSDAAWVSFLTDINESRIQSSHSGSES